MKQILNDLLCLFYPRLCLLCKTPLIKGEEQICLSCLSGLPLTRFGQTTDNPVAQLFIGKIPFTDASAFLYFEKEGHVQTLIHTLKYKDNKELGYQLGRMAALEYQKAGQFASADLLLPVPLHPRRLRQRGYNQAEWIARGISSVWHLPIDTTSVRRIKQTETQTHKQVYERWENVQNTFELTDAEKLQGKHVLLIDDVITTGSTIEACANTIASISGTQVSLLGIAVAQGK